VTVPVVLALGLLLGGAGSDHGAQHPTASGTVLPALSVSPPPVADATTVSKCAQVISELPLTLDGQNLRETVSHPASGQVQAWGDPAIVFSCGVARPKTLVPGDARELQQGGSPAGPYYDVTGSAAGNVWTTVDRAIYISVTIPSAYQGADIIPVVSRAIRRVLPAVCTTDPNTTDLDKLCTRRK
jgi:hypothetical protein